jgi:hypothetical protein
MGDSLGIDAVGEILNSVKHKIKSAAKSSSSINRPLSNLVSSLFYPCEHTPNRTPEVQSADLQYPMSLQKKNRTFCLIILCLLRENA